MTRWWNSLCGKMVFLIGLPNHGPLLPLYVDNVNSGFLPSDGGIIIIMSKYIAAIAPRYQCKSVIVCRIEGDSHLSKSNVGIVLQKHMNKITTARRSGSKNYKGLEGVGART